MGFGSATLSLPLRCIVKSTGAAFSSTFRRERERERERADKLPAAIRRMDSDSDHNDLSDSDSDDSSAAAVVEERWRNALQRIKENDPQQMHLVRGINDNHIQNLTDEEWEELGRDISNNSHLKKVEFSYGWLNDHTMSFLFRGLKKSCSIKTLYLDENGLSVVGVRSMVPFLQNANNLNTLNLSDNDIRSEGFNVLFRALSNSPIELLRTNYSDIQSIDIETEYIPRNLKLLDLSNNSINADGCRGVAKLLQITNSLTCLNLDDNNIQSAGFNTLFRALHDSPIKTLRCSRNRIETLEIDIDHIPGNLKNLFLSENNIDADGCRELAKLLQGRDATLDQLSLRDNKIDDEGVAILVDALKINTSLIELDLEENAGISNQGRVKLLKLVNDSSGIKATLQSNHTLRILKSNHTLRRLDVVEIIAAQIQRLINTATNINYNADSPGAAGREKVIKTQLDSEKRAELTELQGVNQSLYSEIDPLHLPEVLALVGRHHGQLELYLALKSSIAGVISTVNRKECIRQQMAYHTARLKELGAELASIEAAEEGLQGDGGRSKRHRGC